jgi:Ca-activated chloride channel family protein
MTFERPILLWIAPLIAIVVGLLAGWARNRRVKAATAWSASLGQEAAGLGRRSPFILTLAAFLMAIAVAGPRWGLAARSAESRALNVVFVMDISRSMLAQDAEPDRLTRSIRVARRLVQDLSGDRLALIAFAARPYLLSPLTLDQSALAVQLDALDPDVASEGGSSLAGALTLSRQVLSQATEGGDRAVVLFSDGEAFDGQNALQSAAAALTEDGITLISVPVGGLNGERIPDGDGGWHRDGTGQEVITVRRDDLFAVLHEAADGEMIRPDAPDPAGDVRRVLDRLDRRTVRDQMAADLVPRAWIFAVAALLLVGAQAVTRRTAALVAIALCALTTVGVSQRPAQGWQWLRRGDTTRAAEAFLREANRVGTDTAWFNAGTSAMVRGDLVGAIPALERATLSLDPALRRRALYNLGTAQLLAARGDTARRDSLLTGAETALRQALQLDPHDGPTKFNYELARRLRPPPPPPQGGGGSNDPQQGENPPPPPSGGGREGMSQAEAEQVLSAMERAERQTREDLARRQRRTPVRQGPDW